MSRPAQHSHPYRRPSDVVLRRSYIKALTGVVAAASVCALAACSSTPSSSTPAGGTATSTGGTAATASSAPASPATGPTVDVWSAAPIGTVGASAPQRSSGVRAAFNYLNDHGGLGTEHAKVTVKVCNTNLTPQGEIQCAQQAASDPNAIAVIGAINVLAGPQVATVLQKAGLATVNPAVADSSETTSPISFPLAAENLAPTGCALMMPSALKATKIGFAYTSTPATQGEINTAIASAGKAGVTSVGTVSFPITSSDLSPFVEQLAQKNPQAVTLVGSPQDVGQWLTAQASLGKTAPTCTTDALVSNQALTGLGSAASNFYVAGFYPNPDSTAYPLLAQFRQQAEAEVAAGDASASLAPSNNASEVLAGWLGAQAVIQAAANVTGTLTKATLLTALNHTTVTFGTGSGAVLPPIDFAKPNPNPSYPRLFNTQMILKKWDPATRQFVTVPGLTASSAQVAS